MPAPSTATPTKTKITVSLTDEAAAAVEDLASRKGISASETVRRGIALMRFLEEQIEAGSSILVRNKDGELERVQFVFG